MSALVPFAYLAALVGGIICMLLLDWRYRLFFFRRARAAALVTVVGVALLLAWDLAGIALGIFHLGDSPGMTGIMLAPHLPIEEIFFLIFLVLCTMVIYTGTLALLQHRARRGAR